MPASLFDQMAAAERARLNLDAAESQFNAARTAIDRLKAQLSQAENDLRRLETTLEADKKTWTAFAAEHGTFVPIIEAKLKALAEAGYSQPAQAAGAASSPPPSPKATAPRARPGAQTLDATPPALHVSEPTPQPAASSPELTAPSVSEPELKTSPETLAPASPPSPTGARPSGGLRGRRARTPEFSEETVGPLNAPVPNKPKNSPSRKSNAEYRRIWSLNYQRGFDRALRGQPHHATDAPGPSREGRLRGYEDGGKHRGALAWNDDSPPHPQDTGLSRDPEELFPESVTETKPAIPALRQVSQTDLSPETTTEALGAAPELRGPTRAQRVATINALLNHAVIEADFSG